MAGWQLWSLPRPLRSYLILAGAGWAGAAVTALVVTPIRVADLRVFVLLVGCGVVAVEATRRQGEPAGTVTRDLLSAWFLPIAFVLPPVYALLAPVPLLVLTQYRVRRSLPHRLAFAIAAYGLAHALGSVCFQQLLTSTSADLRPGGVALRWAAAAVAAALVATVTNLLLVAVVVRLHAPGSSWRDLMARPEHVVTDLGEVCVGVVLGLLCRLHPLLVLLTVVPVVLLQRALLHEQLRAAARLDPKTGLLNAAAWESQAGAEITRALRGGTSLSVLLLDLDGFKAVNDGHGHLAGDEVLRSVAEVVRRELGGTEVCARFGGDEFAVLLPHSGLAAATGTAGRIRRRVGEIAVPAGDCLIRTSVSVGVAELSHPGQDVSDLLAAADLSLYRAKARRNQGPE